MEMVPTGPDECPQVKRLFDLLREKVCTSDASKPLPKKMEVNKTMFFIDIKFS